MEKGSDALLFRIQRKIYLQALSGNYIKMQDGYKHMKTFIGVVDKDEGSAYGIYFPDLPGCFSASDELEDLKRMAIEALGLYFEFGDVPEPRSIDEIRTLAAEDLKNGAFLMAFPYVDLAGRTVRANITMDAGLLSGIDATAKERGLTRSAFLTQVAKREIFGGHVAENAEPFKHKAKD